eukprot:COSAG03_NODE_4847_length_1413_cov_31.100457_2_plen_88_part_00
MIYRQIAFRYSAERRARESMRGERTADRVPVVPKSGELLRGGGEIQRDTGDTDTQRERERETCEAVVSCASMSVTELRAASMPLSPD